MINKLNFRKGKPSKKLQHHRVARNHASCRGKRTMGFERIVIDIHRDFNMVDKRFLAEILKEIAKGPYSLNELGIARMELFNVEDIDFDKEGNAFFNGKKRFLDMEKKAFIGNPYNWFPNIFVEPEETYELCKEKFDFYYPKDYSMAVGVSKYALNKSYSPIIGCVVWVGSMVYIGINNVTYENGEFVRYVERNEDRLF